MKKRKKQECFIPDLCLSLIFDFMDNDTLWCNVPLVSKRFNFILYDDVKNGLIFRDCNECQYLINLGRKYLLTGEWFYPFRTKEDYKKVLKEHKENIKVKGLKKAVFDNKYEFVCHKHYSNCDICRINFILDYTWKSVSPKCDICSSIICFQCTNFCISCLCKMCIICTKKCLKCNKTFCDEHILKVGKFLKCKNCLFQQSLFK